MTKSYLFVLSCFVSLNLTSCVSTKQLKLYNNLLTKQAEVEQKIIELSEDVTKQTDEEVLRGELSPKNADKVIRKINNETTKAKERQKTYRLLSTELLQSKGHNRKNTKEKAAAILNESNSEVLAYTEKLNLLQDAFEIDNLKTYETAAFFPSGAYKIPKKYQETVSSTFSKVFDDVIGFSSVHNGVQTTAIINTVGYADEQGFNPNSRFVSAAKKKIGDANPSRQVLNQLLSTYRAETLAESLQGLLNRKIANLNERNISQVRINTAGKGEEYPNPLITDYKTIDDRRRIVVVYWNVIPTEFLTE